jgi:D-lactate dehydrogenase (cytochrome)
MSTTEPLPRPGIDSVVDRLRKVVGDAGIVTDPKLIDIYSVDFSEQRLARAGVIVRPRATTEVPEILRIAHAVRLPVAVRGGGMSYTLCYPPAVEGSLMLDMSGLDRIVEVNAEDQYVTVEAGVTWKALYEALQGTGLHMPFGGTMSGERATVGGGLGNNATGVKRGEIADYLLGMEVVLADGRVIQTGSRATGRPVQPVRNYGPDLSGMFIHDAGVFGVKTQATFRLERAPGGLEYASFGFQDTGKLIDAICALARQGLVVNNCAFSEYHNRMFAAEPKPPREEIAAMAAAVRRHAPTPLQGWYNLLRLARPGGLEFLGGWKHSLHVYVEGHDFAIARRHRRAVVKLARSLGGTPLPPGLAIVMRAHPFYPVERLIVGAFEENNTFPTNRVTSPSHARALYAAAEGYFTERADFMTRHGLKHTIIFISVRNTDFGIEPIIYWRDAVNPLRASVLGPARRHLLDIPQNASARAAAVELRQGLVERLNTIPGGHYQIGKFYPYQRDLRDDACRSVMRDLKTLFDPQGILNPGGLGL